MDWKKPLPKDLFFVTRNGLVVPRYISKPEFSFILIFLVAILVAVFYSVFPFGYSIKGGSSIILPKILNEKFMYYSETGMGYADGITIIHVVEVRNKLYYSLDGDAFSEKFGPVWNKTIKNIDLKNTNKSPKEETLLNNRSFMKSGCFGNENKVFFMIDERVKWGDVVDVLKATQMAGIRDVCFLTE